MSNFQPFGQSASRRRFLGCLGLAAALPPTRLARQSETLIPVTKFPSPKFHIGEEVFAPWEESEGDDDFFYHYRAVIIGMVYDSEIDGPGWWYLPRWLESESCPWMVGKDDDIYRPEEHFRKLAG